MARSSFGVIFPAVAGAALSFIVLVEAPGCGGDDTRRGKAGESCQRADDCEDGLSCIDKVCVDPNAPDGGGGTGGGGAGGPSADAGPWGACDGCLDQECANELAACDVECQAIEACIETLCTNLSKIGSPDEGECQTFCQDAHPGAKDKHLEVVNCAQAASCVPTCMLYPTDYDACVLFMNAGDCGQELGACKSSLDCQNYKDCVATCTTLKECIACDDTPAGAAGHDLYDTYERCIAAECVSESWLP